MASIILNIHYYLLTVINLYIKVHVGLYYEVAFLFLLI